MRKNISLLFVHGFPLDSSMWEEQKCFLEDSYSVYCPDLPGFGSNNEIAPSTIEGYAEYIKKYVKEKNLENIVLCGFSMGGHIALAFYEAFPQIIQALILVDTRAKNDSPEGKNQRNNGIQNAQVYGTKYFEENMLSKLLSGENINNKEIVLRVKKMISKQRQDSIINALKAMRDRKDRSFLLKKIDVPTLFICGEKDVLTPSEEMKEMSAYVTNSKFQIVKGAGHLSNIENAGQFNEIVFGFLESIRGEK
ncbi:MAG: alpha/beta hydrolase [Acidobacteria bacterium]|nr:alpha/beta hydrolase [Acidobacteriota bacterium]